MKNFLTPFLGILVISVLAAGCGSDDVEDILTTDVDVTISDDVHVVVGENDPLSYEKTFAFDASSYVSNLEIESYSVDKLTVDVTNYTGAATKITNLSLAVVGTNLTINIPNLEFATINNKGPVNIQMDSGIFTALADEFAKDNELTIDATATLDGKPADFNLKLTIHGKVTGKLL